MKTKFRLYKRMDDGKEMAPTAAGYKEQSYYFRFTFRGKSYPRCLETTDATEAQRRARIKYQQITEAVTRGQLAHLEASKMRQSAVGTIAQLEAAYLLSPSEAGSTTRDHNINALHYIVPATGSVQDLNPAAVRAYFAAVQVKAMAESDQGKAASLRRSANSVWAKARSLFTPRCLEYYRGQNLYHECLEAFVSAGNLAKFSSRAVPKVMYNPPADKIITATLTAWAALADQDRNLYLAIGHELAFGLRIGEMAQAKWGWHQIRSGYPVLDGTATVKSGSGMIQVRALDPWYRQMQVQMQLHAWRGDPDDHIITGSEAYRQDGLFRAASDWLRKLGWETKKTNHALRAYAGGQVAMKYGIYEAQMFLRHSTVKVTEQNYAHFIKKFRPADPETIPARWAVVTGDNAKVASKENFPKDATLDASGNVQKGGIESNTGKPEEPMAEDQNP